MPLEIACFNIHSAFLAFCSSADRIELCANPSVGGTTPPLASFQLTRETISKSERKSIPINVMLRPRGGDFVYTDEEFEIMERDVRLFDEEGADGLVFGILKSSGKGDELEIDVERCSALLSLVKSNTKATHKNKPSTFHRAFDALPPSTMLAQLEVLITLGFAAVLTSGGAPNAVEGKEMLRKLVERAAGRIEVIVGGGVRSGNLGKLRSAIYGEGVGVGEKCWWHSSAITEVKVEGEGYGDGETASEGEIAALAEVLRGGGRGS